MKTLFRVLVVTLAWTGHSIAGETWIEDSFEEFADGRLDAAGQNLYVARDGSVRTIHRFDLNQDGYLDLVFNNTHDRYTSIPATVAWRPAKSSIQHAPLAVDGSRQAAAADLNQDGYLDLVFCPNAGGVQHGRRFITILWGGPDGWPAHRANGALPVHHAVSLVVADLNADGWPDLISLNGAAWLPGQPEGNVVRVYWGSQNGFLLSRLLDLGVPAASALASADFDGDGVRDLAVLQSTGQVRVYWAERSESLPTRIPFREVALPGAAATCLASGDLDADGRQDLVCGTSEQAIYLLHGAGGRAWRPAVAQDAVKASHVCVGDLDGDHVSDLVLTDFTLLRAAGGEAGGAAAASPNVHILWGTAHGFSRQHAMELPAPQAIATAVGDLDGDELPDLAIAIHQGEKSLQTHSTIYFNQGPRRFERRGDELPTTGATDVVIAAAHQGLPARAIFSNSAGGTVGEAVPLQVYWGSRDGFSVNNVWKIPFASGYESTAADLNRDGFVDFIELNSGHAGEISNRDPHLGANIFWGGPSGFDIDQRRTVLREFNLGTSNVADLNRDGYLDLVLGQFAPGKGQESAELIVYFGDRDGFSRQRRVGIPSPGRSISSVVADLNGDEWLDVTVNSFDRDVVRIFWGGSDGLDAARQRQISVHSPIDVETADLNRDGNLDLIVGVYQDRLASHHDMGSTIFWGGKHGFQHWNAQWLPGQTPIGHCVADFDADGHLDLFSPHYHGDLTRESIPAYLYWGSAMGFSIDRKTSLICDSSDDALAADFDRDGRLDLAVVCHSRNDRHDTVSKVFYNDGQRFARPRVTELPTAGPHWMWQQDMGHIATRAWRQTYESSPFHFEQVARQGILQQRVTAPEGTRIAFAVRSGATEERLQQQPWRSLERPSFDVRVDDRWLQYRATFTSDNGDRYGILERVEIQLQE